VTRLLLGPGPQKTAWETHPETLAAAGPVGDAEASIGALRRR
jgi:hypothetical protein